MKNFYKSLIALIKGHWTIFKHSFKKRVTLEYPEKKLPHRNLRGKIEFNYDAKCNGCGLCQKVCPAKGTITILKSQNIEGKQILADYQIDLAQCIFCGQCVENCPTKALIMSNNYELATNNKNDLKLKRSQNGNI